MIISSSLADLLDHSVHRGLWSMLPARAQRALAALRPLGVTETPRPARRGELAAAALSALALVAMQQWVWLILLVVALAGTLASLPALRARATHIAAARQKMKQNLMASEARARRAQAEAMIITMIIMSSLFCFFAALCRAKTKSINHNLIHRIFGQQLAGAVRQ